MKHQKQVRKVLLYTLLLNISVASVKVYYGYKTGVISMFSDGFHSFFDGTSNIIGLIGIWIAAQPPDKNHPYGHRKFETLSTVAIAILIFIAGSEILREVWHRMYNPVELHITPLSFIIMAVTLTVNIMVMRYETKKGREFKSSFLLADAKHTKSDIFVSLSVIISLIAASTGYPVVDIIAAGIITILIAFMGFSILKEAAVVLTDTACMETEELKKLVIYVMGVKDCHEIRTRGDGAHISIDLHILVDPDTRIETAHEIAHAVEETIKMKYPSVRDVVIHIEPFKEDSERT
jgi:cation diffusion facilitator family transporter